jgi:hypothetical protein
MTATAMIDMRDLFLSHRSSNKELARTLAADIEAKSFGDRHLSVWLDEAEIPIGGSLPAHINRGLENSRFVLLLMTPAYFESESGWTDAEWHAALSADPDNRRHRLLPATPAHWSRPDHADRTATVAAGHSWRPAPGSRARAGR